MTTEQFLHRSADPRSPNRICSLSREALVRSAYWQTHSNISRLDAKIDKLLLRRRDLRIHRHLLSTLLSPVRFLPPELLGEIFRYCLPQDYDELGAHKAVMLPSHVCKRWRDVALSTPALWTNIVLHVTDKTLESQTALVTDWVSRSGNLPLSFTLEGRENVLPILAVLYHHCARWQYINLSVPLETLQCLEAANGRLQRLETLEINRYGDSPPWVEQILESAPKLRKVSVSRKFLWNGLNGSWGQLVELDASCASYSVGDCLALLQAVGSLQTLKVSVNSEVAEGHPRFVFSHPLISLDVCGTGACWMLFDYITLPNIRDLSVGEIESQLPVSQLISFLQRSSSFLRCFSFRVPSAVYGSWVNMIIQILGYTPSLHTLCLAYGSSYARWDESSIFEKLEFQAGGLIPMLSTISISIGNQSVTPEYQALRELILSRRSMDETDDVFSIMYGVERIQKLTVECSYCWDDTAWHEEVSQILAPIQIVDTLQIVVR
jgi:F-box-like